MSVLRLNSGETTSNTATRAFSKTTLVCSVAHAIGLQPALNPAHAKDKLIWLDAEKRMYLLKYLKLFQSTVKTMSSASFRSTWSSRPFQYSSATNTAVADVVVDLLESIIRSHRGDHEVSSKILLDPTCGSGTFLSLAMDRAFEVIGWDRNPSCIDPSEKNLLHVHGEERVKKHVTLKVRDGSLLCEKRIDVSCVACNVPWGLNSANYDSETTRILTGIRCLVRRNSVCFRVEERARRSCVSRIPIP